MLRKVYIIGAILSVFLLCTTPIVVAEDEEEAQEPIYENEHHFFRPLNIHDSEGEISADTLIKIYEEPREGDSEGLDYGRERDWDEPLYYKGSTKTIWLTYNGFGFCIVVEGPDFCLNTHIYIMIHLRYVEAQFEFHLATGILPV